MTTTTGPGVLTGLAPMFLVDDVERTAGWYRDHLGFEAGDYFRSDHGPDGSGDAHDEGHPASGEAVFAIINRNGHRLLLGRTERKGHGVISSREYKEYSSDAYLWADGIEEYFAFVKTSGAEITMDLALQPYGLLEFGVVDCDGRHLTVGGPPSFRGKDDGHS